MPNIDFVIVLHIITVAFMAHYLIHLNGHALLRQRVFGKNATSSKTAANDAIFEYGKQRWCECGENYRDHDKDGCMRPDCSCVTFKEMTSDD